MLTIHFHYCAIKNPFCELFLKKIIICISRIIFKLKGIKKCFKLPPRQIKLYQNVKLPTNNVSNPGRNAWHYACLRFYNRVAFCIE